MASRMDKVKQFVVEKVAHMKKPFAEVTDIDMTNVSMQSITLESAIDISNPYCRDLPIGQISYRLLSENRIDVDLESTIDITNPYGHDLPIGQISYRLLSANREIASGTIVDPGSVKANDKTGMIIPVTVPYDFLLNIMTDVGRDWDIDYTWEMGLTMHIPIVGKFTLPLNKKGTMKLPTLSDILSDIL